MKTDETTKKFGNVKDIVLCAEAAPASLYIALVYLIRIFVRSVTVSILEHQVHEASKKVKIYVTGEGILLASS
jgi:uncharacterized membrane protein